MFIPNIFLILFLLFLYDSQSFSQTRSVSNLAPYSSFQYVIVKNGLSDAVYQHPKMRHPLSSCIIGVYIIITF